MQEEFPKRSVDPSTLRHQSFGIIGKSDSNFIYSSKLPTVIKETKFDLPFGNLIKLSNKKFFVGMNSIL